MSIIEHEIESMPSDVYDDEKTEVNVSEANPETDGVENDAGGRKRPGEKARARVSISVRALIIAGVVCVAASAIGVLTWLYIGAQSKLNAEARAAGNKKRAEEIAQDYAIHAAEMNYQDLNSWKVQLVRGTSPELKEKLTKAAREMEQILTPLQWVSTARPLMAKVRSDAGGTYVVDSFVSVLTKTMQAPEGLQSTATYSLTVDSNKDWQISDVGGIDAALGSK